MKYLKKIEKLMAVHARKANPDYCMHSTMKRLCGVV